MLVLRPDSPLFWANATPVTHRLRTLAEGKEDVRALVLDLEATNQMDTTTTERLSGLLGSLRSSGIDLYLVRVFGDVRDVLTRSGFLDDLGPGHVWHSIAAGVKAARKSAAFAAPVNGPEEDEEDDSDAATSRSTSSRGRPTAPTATGRPGLTSRLGVDGVAVVRRVR